MLSDIIYQVSIFGDFTSITPNDTVIQSMITTLREYELFPAIFQEGVLNISPDPNNATVQTMNRLQMISLDKMLNVMFSSNRIDISKSSVDLSVSLTDDNLNTLLDILSKATPGLSFSRIALNSTSLLDDETQYLQRKLQSGLDFYDNPNELMLRVNKRKEISIEGNHYEDSNVILTVQRTVGQIIMINQPVPIDNGVITQFDINTIAENTTLRFFSDHVKKYILSANSIRQSILNTLIS